MAPQFGQTYATALRRRDSSPRRPVAPRRSVPQDQRPAPLSLRAVDQDGEVLDILAQRHRDKKAAKKLQVK